MCPSVFEPGLHTESHGMTGNDMYDVSRNESFLVGTNPEQFHTHWWDGGDPLWITAARQVVCVCVCVRVYVCACVRACVCCVYNAYNMCMGVCHCVYLLYMCIVSVCCLLYTSPSPRDRHRSRMPSSA